MAVEAGTVAQPIVVIDDDDGMRQACREVLRRGGYDVAAFADGAAGLAAIARLRPPLVIVDLKMPGLSGFDVVRRAHEVDPTIVVVVITGYATIETAIEAMKAGAYDFLPKPFSPDQLRLLVARALERRRLQLASSAHEVEREMLRRRFVSFVSHQLKAPLASIHQALTVLRRLEGVPAVEAKRAAWIDRCVARVGEACSLVDEWLTLSRIESQSLGGRREPVEVGALLQRVVGAQAERAAELGVTLELDTPARPCVVEGDATCLGVLFENLLDNALKYQKPRPERDAGGPPAQRGLPAGLARFVRLAAGVDAGELVVTVADDGQGIAEDALPYLFDEFYRARAAQGGVRGSGLGLAICKRIATEAGGTIEVASTPGIGSTFRVRLPLASAVAEGAVAPVPVEVSR